MSEKMGCAIGCWVRVQPERSTSLSPALKSSMNESVELTANSLILTGLTFRTFSVAVSDCVWPFAVQEALAIRSPLKAAGPEVTLKVALTLAPGATGSANVLEVPLPSETTEVQPAGTEMLNLTSIAGALLHS